MKGKANLGQKKILLYSQHRTGSTVLWNILDTIFSPPNNKKIYRWKNPANVKKTHQIIELIDFLEDNPSKFDKVFIPLRDPTGMSLSSCRIRDKLKNKRQIIKNTNKTLNNINEKNRILYALLKENLENVVLIDYEKEILNLPELLRTIESTFSIEIKNKEKLIKDFSKESVFKKIPVGRFKRNIDKLTNFHGDHVCPKNIDYQEYSDLVKTSYFFKLARESHKKLLSLKSI